MSYLVLARKYRPQTFTDMIGQGHVVRTLTNAIASNRVAHGFLFTGARGVGKTTGARLLAKALNCAIGPTPEPCGECPSCKEITAGTNVDVQEIDGASNNGVDQVRELRDNARYLPSRDRHKIYIIDEVHMLSGAAFNALLKTLEEPPPHVKFIFATTEPHKIPVTILSRTQRFDFRRIPLSQIVGRIESILEAEKISMSPRAAALVARQAEGSMRDALSLLDQVISACGVSIQDHEVEEILGVIDRTEVASLAGALIGGDGALALQIVARVFDRGLDLARLAEDLSWHIRNLLVVKVGGKAEEVLDVADHEMAGLVEQAESVAAATLSFLFDMVHGSIQEIGKAVQPRLVFEVALLKAIHMAPGVDLAGLVDRVEGMLGGEALSRPAPPKPDILRAPKRTNKEKVEDVAALDGPFGSYAARMQARAMESLEKESRISSPHERSNESKPSDQSVESGSKEYKEDGEEDAGAKSPGAVKGKTGHLGSDSETRTKEPEVVPQKKKKSEDSDGSTGLKALEGDSSKKEYKIIGVAPTGSPSAQETPHEQRAGVESESRLSKGDDPASSLADRYSSLVNAITALGKKPFLAAALEHARPLSIGDEEISLALPRGIYYDGLHGSSNTRMLEMLLEDHFGRPMHLRLEVAVEKNLDGVPESIASEKERRLAKEVESIREEAMKNPAVRLAVEALDGEIESIKILGHAD